MYSSGCIPASPRQGTIVHAYKKADTSESGNYRPLTTMSCMDKIFSVLLMGVVPLHDQQYAFEFMAAARVAAPSMPYRT